MRAAVCTRRCPPRGGASLERELRAEERFDLWKNGARLAEPMRQCQGAPGAGHTGKARLPC